MVQFVTPNLALKMTADCLTIRSWSNIGAKLCNWSQRFWPNSSVFRRNNEIICCGDKWKWKEEVVVIVISVCVHQIRMQIDGSDVAFVRRHPSSCHIQLTNKLSMCEWQGQEEYILGFTVCEMRKSCLAHYVNNVIMQRTLRSSIQHVSKDEINVSHSIPTYFCWSLCTIICSRLPWHTLHDAVKHPTDNTKQTRAKNNNDDDDNDQRKIQFLASSKRQCSGSNAALTLVRFFIYFIHRMSQVVRIIIILCAHKCHTVIGFPCDINVIFKHHPIDPVAHTKFGSDIVRWIMMRRWHIVQVEILYWFSKFAEYFFL